MGVKLQKNKRNEEIYARKQECLTLITLAPILPPVISMFFCLLVHFLSPEFPVWILFSGKAIWFQSFISLWPVV